MALQSVTTNKTITPITITQGGFREDLTNSEYHGESEHLSSSQVKKAVDSPANYRFLLTHKEEEEDKWDKDSRKDFGSLVHALALEAPYDPEVIDREFAFIKVIGENTRTKAWKEYRDQIIKDNPDKIVIPEHKLEIAKNYVEAIKAHPFANELVFGKGKSEYSGFTVCPYSGRKIKIRIDRKCFQYGIVDLKTTEDITKFRSIAKYVWHYDLSAYKYVMASAAITGEVEDYYFVVIDDRMRVEVRKASEKFLAEGKEKYERSMDNISIALGEDKPELVRWQEVDYQEI